MNPNVIVPEHTFSEDEIAQPDPDIEPLYQALLPDASLLLERVVRPRMEEASAKASFPDMHSLVDQIPDDALDCATSPGEHPGQIREALKKLLSSDVSVEEDDDWFQKRAEDLTYAVVLFWLELGLDTRQRREHSASLLKESKRGLATEDGIAFRLIAERFYLGDEAFTLLSRLSDLAE